MDGGVQAGNQAFQHKGGLAGAGNPGHHSQPPLGNFDVQRLYGVDGIGGKLNAPQREQLALRGLGSQALRFARQEQPNVILLDIIMPGMSGFKTARILSRDQATHNIPVIFVTIRDSEADRSWGMRQGATAYVTVPVNPQLLLTAISEAIAA